MKYKSKPYYIDDNKIIQDFMNWKLVCHNPNAVLEESEDYILYSFIQYDDKGNQIDLSSCSDGGEGESWFKDSVIDFKEWTELHMVIEKLEKLGYAMTIDPWSIEMIEYRSGNEDSLMIYQENYGDYETKLDWYYDCVVEFLKLRISENFIEKYEK